MRKTNNQYTKINRHQKHVEKQKEQNRNTTKETNNKKRTTTTHTNK